MATAFKSLDTTIPFTPAPRPNIRVVWSQGAAMQAVATKLADQPAAQATLEELQIADLTRGVIATARQLLSPRMYAAFLRWGEAAARLDTRFEGGDDVGGVLCTAQELAVHAVADVPPANEHDLALKRYLLAIETTDSPPSGPVYTDRDNCTSGCGDMLVRSLGPEMVPQSPVALAIDALATQAWAWSQSTSAWSTEIGGAITAAYVEAQRLLVEEGEGAGTRPLDLSAYDLWTRGPLLAWNRQYERHLASEEVYRTYQRDVYNPTLDAKGVEWAKVEEVQDRFGDLVNAHHDELMRLYLLPAPGAAELAIKLQLFDSREDHDLTAVKEIIAQLAADARRCAQDRLGISDPHPEWLRSRNAALERVDSTEEDPAEDNLLLSEVNLGDTRILETAPRTKDGVLAQLILAAQVAAEGHELAEDMAKAVVRNAITVTGAGYLAHIGDSNLSELGR